MTAHPDRQNPFVGLRPFESSDSLYFFGRDQQVGELLQRLEANRFLGVVGSSGSGKSSLIRAGLIPALEAGFLVEERDSWRVATLRPGDDPLGRLAAAALQLGQEKSLASEAVLGLRQEITGRGLAAILERLGPKLKTGRANLLLLVDQFEEIFRSDSVRDESASSQAKPDRGAVEYFLADNFFHGHKWTRILVNLFATISSLTLVGRLFPMLEVFKVFRGVVLKLEGITIEFESKTLGPASQPSEMSQNTRDFVQLLLQLAAQREVPIYVVLTMRSDFLGQCSIFEGLPEALNRCQYLVPRLTRPQRRQAIVGPVQLMGARIASELVERLLNEQITQDDLPLLQHALMRTWDGWKRKQAGEGDVGLVDYTAVGMIEKSLDQHAEEALKGMKLRQEAVELQRNALVQEQGELRGLSLVWMERHNGSVHGVQTSPDGQRILSWGEDGTVRLSNSHDGSAATPPMKHEQAVRGAAFSVDGQRLLSWSEDGTVRLWNIHDGSAATPPMKHEKTVEGAAFSADGRRILSWSDDGTVRLWNNQDGSSATPPMKHEQGVRRAVFSGDRQRILSWSWDGTVRLWNSQDGSAA
ncbi:MAG: hypothetical protein L0Z50_02755, partial [Verrucomicrobiales bacterium]|nr:hypothetical protein [Verrucomicrobiales bacterium]